MAENVVDMNFVINDQRIDALPEVGIHHRLPLRAFLAPPAVLLPLGHPLGDPLGYILAIGHQLDLAGALQRGEPLDDAEQLHPVVGRVRLGAGGIDDPAGGGVLEDIRPAAGAGVAATSAIRVKPDEVWRARGIHCHVRSWSAEGTHPQTNAEESTGFEGAASSGIVVSLRRLRMSSSFNTCGRRRQGRQELPRDRGRSASSSCWPARGERGSSRDRFASRSPRPLRRERPRSDRHALSPGGG